MYRSGYARLIQSQVSLFLVVKINLFCCPRSESLQQHSIGIKYYYCESLT